MSAFLTVAALSPLRIQLPGLRVVSQCSCGCPTVSFENGPEGATLIAEAQVSNTDGDAILLFATAGALTSLEYLWLGDAPPLGWPPASWLSDLRAR